MSQNASLSFYHNDFYELSLDDLYDILRLRSLVFNHQQNVIQLSGGECVEIDGEDKKCSHIIGRNEDREIIATARLFDNNESFRLGRLAVHPELQKKGVGKLVMNYLDSIINSKPIDMHAQSYLIDWYSKLGWSVKGEEFMECGIKHIIMTKNQ